MMEANSKVTVLTSEPLGMSSYLKKVWDYRSMIITLTVRDVKVKYAQTFLGILWAVLQPLVGVLVFTFFFTQLIQLDSTIPYPLIALSGIAAWYFFSSIIHSAGISLMQAQDLIKKVYFPRLVILISKILSGLIDLGITLCLLVILMFVFGVFPGIEILFVPVFIILTIVFGLSISLWLSALTLRYRDFHHIIPYLLNYGIWLTPVFFPVSIIPEKFNWLIYLNPMAAVIAGFRWSLLGDTLPDWQYWISFVPIVIILISGLDYFRRNEYKIADYA